MPIWLAMTLPAPESINISKKKLSIEEIGESLQGVGEEINQIFKLQAQENMLVEQFFASLPTIMKLLSPSIEIAPEVIPFKRKKIVKANIDSAGQLTLMFESGYEELIDLSETRNRDIMMAVASDIMPKLTVLASNFHVEETKAPAKAEKIQPPSSLPLVQPVKVETSVTLETSVPEVKEEPPKAPEVPVLLDKNAKIFQIETETLEFLDLLSRDVFEIAPISRFFDDWMVNLRQVILSFESNEAINPVDEEFTKQFNEIFGNIEEELARRLLNEAELEVSTKSLEENKTILGEMDAGYAAQTKDYVVKGKGAIDFLIKNVQHLEQEIAELEKTKTSYLHPLKKMAKDQKQAELTKKLVDAKKRLALAVGGSTITKPKLGAGVDLDAEYAAQTKELAEKRKIAIGVLVKEVRELDRELNRLYMEPESRNPLKKLTHENKLIEVKTKWEAAKQRLRLAEKDSGEEQKKLHEEYLKKKQEMVGKMQNLEKDIKTKEVDTSVEARKTACKAMAEAVKALIQRKTTSVTENMSKERTGNQESPVANT